MYAMALRSGSEIASDIRPHAHTEVMTRHGIKVRRKGRSPQQKLRDEAGLPPSQETKVNIRSKQSRRRDRPPSCPAFAFAVRGRTPRDRTRTELAQLFGPRLCFVPRSGIPKNEQERPDDQVFLPVDQRRFELLTSPVRGVPKSLTATHMRSHSRPSTQVKGHFRITAVSIHLRLFPRVLLGIC